MKLRFTHPRSFQLSAGWLLACALVAFAPIRSPAQVAPVRTNQAPRLSGLVRDPSGAPVAGVLVSYHPGHHPGAALYTEARTDQNGRYELILQLNPAIFNGEFNQVDSILARSFERNLAAVMDFSEPPSGLDLILQPGITLSGSLKDEAGAPVTNATVDLYFSLGRSAFKLGRQPIPVDAQGLFSVPSLPQGRTYFISQATATGYGSAFGRAPTKGTQANHYEFPVVVLKRADRILAGQVLDADGKPLAGAMVNFNGSGQRARFPGTKSDSQGRFVLEGVCDGDVQVSGYWDGPPGSGVFLASNQGGGDVKTHAGDTNIILRLRGR